MAKALVTTGTWAKRMIFVMFFLALCWERWGRVHCVFHVLILDADIFFFMLHHGGRRLGWELLRVLRTGHEGMEQWFFLKHGASWGCFFFFF